MVMDCIPIPALTFSLWWMSSSTYLPPIGLSLHGVSCIYKNGPWGYLSTYLLLHRQIYFFSNFFMFMIICQDVEE